MTLVVDRPSRRAVHGGLLATLAFAVACPASGTGVLRVVAGDLDPLRWLGATAAQAHDAGARELVPIAVELGLEGGEFGGFVDVPEGECILAFARPADSVDDVDLFLLSDGGDLVGADEGPEAAAAVILCPPHPKRVYAAARVVTGTGVVALGAMSLPPEAAQAVALAVQARGQDGDATGRLSAWPGLETKILERRRALGAHWDDLRRVALAVAPGATSLVTVPVPARACVDVLAVPGDEVNDIDLELVDEQGRVFARGEGIGRQRAVVACAGEKHDVTVRIRPRLTGGICAVIVSRSSAGAAAELSSTARVGYAIASQGVEAALAQLDADLAARGLPLPRRIGAGEARGGLVAGIEVELGAGCGRLDIVAGRPLGPLDATLWATDGSELAHASGGAGATLFRCGPASKARLEVRALGTPGPFAVEARFDASPPPGLLAAPLAAAALFARLDDAAGPIGPDLGQSVEHVALRSGTLAVLPLAVAAGTCVEVIAAVESGSGLEIRLHDEDVAERLVARGERVASRRLCADSDPVSGTVELLLDVGASDALVLRRELSREKSVE